MAHPSTQALAKATLPKARPALASKVRFTSTTLGNTHRQRQVRLFAQLLLGPSHRDG